MCKGKGDEGRSEEIRGGEEIKGERGNKMNNIIFQIG